MVAQSNDELKREVEAEFGTTLTEAEIESGKGRLPTMLDNARLLADWGAKLGTTCPSQMLQVAEAPARKADGDD